MYCRHQNITVGVRNSASVKDPNVIRVFFVVVGQGGDPYGSDAGPLPQYSSGMVMIFLAAFATLIRGGGA